MKTKITEHILSILLVSVIMLSVLFFINLNKKQADLNERSNIQAYIDLDFINYDNNFHKALFKDVLNIFYPDQYEKNNSIIESINKYRQRKFTKTLQKSNLKERLSLKVFIEILKMYLKFILVYILVMILTYYGVQTLGAWRFIRNKQKSTFQQLINKSDYSKIKRKNQFFCTISRAILSLPSKIVKIILYFILFSPAYVIAYSIRTEFNTDTIFFMVLLGVISNGLLVVYANKFFAFLVAESRKGYVENAYVKNLNNSYFQHTPDGISFYAIFRPVKHFKGHIFEHIFRNAHYQYISTIKEQASFLITGLIIIEMALNIHGHLNYEMMRQLLYKNYDIVIIIILGIFYTVKLTELLIDIIMHKESMKYENIA